MTRQYRLTDPAICHCCRLPTCLREQPGRGRICLGCVAHYSEAFGLDFSEEERQRRDQDHTAFAGMVNAAYGYFLRDIAREHARA